MSHASCPDCGLRFSATVAAATRSCPMCSGPLHVTTSAAELVGHQLYFEPSPEAPSDPPRPGAC